MKLPCEHRFHHVFVKEWLKRHLNCLRYTTELKLHAWFMLAKKY